MQEKWIPRCLEYPHTFLGLLYMASAHDDVVHTREIERLETAALRQDVIHHVAGNLTNKENNVADHNIIAVLQLITEGIMNGNEATLHYHVNGLSTMIRERGGLQQLDSVLASMALWLMLEVNIMNEAPSAPMYNEYTKAYSTAIYPTMAVVPESPLWCPQGDRFTLQRSTGCSKLTLKLVEVMRWMIDGFLSTVSLYACGNSSLVFVLKLNSRRNYGLTILENTETS
jgi:hypothetical protein